MLHYLFPVCECADSMIMFILADVIIIVCFYCLLWSLHYVASRSVFLTKEYLFRLPCLHNLFLSVIILCHGHLSSFLLALPLGKQFYCCSCLIPDQGVLFCFCGIPVQFKQFQLEEIFDEKHLVPIIWLSWLFGLDPMWFQCDFLKCSRSRVHFKVHGFNSEVYTIEALSN